MSDEKTIVVTPKTELTSKRWSLNLKDWKRSALVVGLTGLLYPAILPVAQVFADSINVYFTTNNQALAPFIATLVSSGMAYLGKNFGTSATKQEAVSNDEHDEIKEAINLNEAAK